METKVHFISGKQIFLREVRPEDVNDRYYAWMNDPETTRYLEIRHFPVSKEEISGYVKAMGGRKDTLFLAICQKTDGLHVGNIKLGPINMIHRFASISILIGDKTCRRKGYATEAIRILSEFAFHSLNLNRISAGLYQGNTGSLRAFENAGFSKEGVFKKMRFFKGTYIDQIMVGMLREDIEKSDGTYL